MIDAVTSKTRAYEASEANYHEARQETVSRLSDEIEVELEEIVSDLKSKLAITEMDSHVLETLKIGFTIE